MKKAGSSLLLLAFCLLFCSHSAVAAVLFGPHQYVRTTGGTTIFTDTFAAPAGTARLFIENGQWDGDHRVDNQVSSARVLINDIQIYGPSDFNKNVHMLETSVNLAEASTIKVELNGSPESYLTIKITRPSVSLDANPAIIQPGESATLNWASSEIKTCTIAPAIGPVASNGSTSVSPTETTSYTITAVDPVGIATSASRQIRVNNAPMANAQSVVTDEDTPAAIALSGSDADSDQLTFRIASGPNHGTLSGTPPALTYSPNPNYNGPDAFSFIVNDGMVDSGAAIVTIIINPVNDMPVADAGADQIVLRGDTVALDGSGSRDIDNDALSYRWTFFAVPAGSAAVLSNPALPNPTFVADMTGVYNVQLVVNDGMVDSASDAVRITVNPRIVPVPDLTGLPRADAEVAIASAHLIIGTIASIHHDTIPAGNVISQAPAAGASVEENSLVDLVISLGPEVQPPTVSIQAVPNSIMLGESAILSWTAANAGSVAIDNGVGSVGPAGSAVVSPTRTTSYTITATGPGGTATATCSVRVQSAEGLDYGLRPGSPSGSSSMVGGTINILNGNNVETRTDINIASANRLGLFLQATYNSRSATLGAMGYGWLHTCEAALETAVQLGTGQYLKITDATGRQLFFKENEPGVFTGAFNEKTHVQFENNEYVWYREDGGRCGFTHAGQLAWLADENDNRLVITYSVGLPATVTDTASGRTLSFNYSNGLLASISGPVLPAIPDGIWVSYGYDSHQNLTSVTYADGSGFLYAYTDPADVHNLTGKWDKESHLVNSWSYANEDRAGSSSDLKGAGAAVHYVSETQAEVTDSYGALRTYTISAINGRKLVTAMAGPAAPPYSKSNAARWVYDENLNLTEVAYAGGTVVRYADYDERGNPGAVTLAVGTPEERTISFTYHPDKDAVLTRTEASVLGSGSKATIFDYDSDGNGVANENPGPNPGRIVERGFTTNTTGQVVAYEYVTALTYNEKGQLLSVNGPLPGDGDTTVYSYDPATGALQGITQPLIGTTIYTDYDAAGRVGRIVDVNGQSTSITYDAASRVLDIANNADGSSTSFVYTLAGEPRSMTDPDNISTDFSYDPASGRLSRTTDPAGNYMAYGYDSQGNRTALTKHTAAGERTYVKSWDYQYPDIPGLLWKETQANGSFTEYGYDAAANLARLTDPEGHTTTYQYDALNRLTRTIQPGEIITSYGYDPQGNLTSVIDPEGQQTSYGYDDLGRLVYSSSADTGATRYEYDEAGNLTSKTDARGIIVIYTYDVLSRLKAIHYPNSAEDVTFSYDQGANAMGRRSGMTDASGSTSWGYDNRGRLAGQTSTISGFSYSLTRSFTPGGRLANVIYPGGRAIDYSHNLLGKIDAVSTTRNNLTSLLISNLVYQPFGSATGMATGAGSTVNNQTGECDCGVAVSNPGARTERAYSYDNNKNLIGITWTNMPWRNVSYAYDELNRLMSATGPFGVESYTYDKAGNRMSREQNGRHEEYSYIAAGNRLNDISGAVQAAYGYDANGNTTASANRSFIYNQDNRLIQVKQNTTVLGDYAYNGLGQRVSKSANGATTIFLYDPDGNIIAEGPGNGTLSAEYLYLGSSRLAKVDTATGSIYHYLNERLGTPVALVDANNNAVWEATYTPFGTATVNQNSTVVNNFRFAGQYYDAETGLHHNGHRYYDPNTGRYLTPDPIGLAGGINPYLYVGADPINWIDPNGLSPNYDTNGNGIPDYKEIALPTPHFSASDMVLMMTPLLLGMPFPGEPVLGSGGASSCAASADTIAEGMRISPYRFTGPGETFTRYESANPAFSKITPSGGVKPGTFAAPASDGLVPVGQRASAYNLPNPEIPRPNAVTLTPPAGTPIIGPRPVPGASGNEVIFWRGF